MNPILDRAHAFLLSNARLLERRAFERLFLGGEAAEFVRALLVYQNPDGGFGNALEPDKRCAASQPVDQEVALHYLLMAEFDAEISCQICDWLATVSVAGGAVPFVLPSVRSAARAPWWEPEGETPPAALNPSASILGLLYSARYSHKWMEGATAFCWQVLEQGQLQGAHDYLAAFKFLEHVPDRTRAIALFERHAQHLFADGLVALEVDAPGYSLSPLKFAPTPASLCRMLFEADVFERHLDALAASQQPDGGWAINWQALTPFVEMECRGMLTVSSLQTLRAYGRI